MNTLEYTIEKIGEMAKRNQMKLIQNSWIKRQEGLLFVDKEGHLLFSLSLVRTDASIECEFCTINHDLKRAILDKKFIVEETLLYFDTFVLNEMIEYVEEKIKSSNYKKVKTINT